MEKYFKIIELPEENLQVLLMKDFEDDENKEESSPALTVMFIQDGVKLKMTIGCKTQEFLDRTFNKADIEFTRNILSEVLQNLK